MQEQVQAVVAGSKAFVDALDAHLRLRLGAAPLLARSPVEAMEACTGEGGLLILEYGGPDWLEAVKSLRTVRDRAALPIVAAVPFSRMAELGALQRAGVDEAVRWDARVDPVLWAVDRLVAARRRGGAPRASARDAARAAAGPGVAVEIREAPIDCAEAAVADALVPLPSELPSGEEVAKLLRAALAREASPDEAWRPLTERVASQLGDLERVALSGAPFPLDAAPLRMAACLRWRIAAVMESARATGSPPDAEIASALPIEVDAVLAALKALAEAAGAELQPGIEAARNALVREAIGFTDAIAVALVPAEGQPAATLVERRPAARVITNESTEATPQQRRPAALWIALAVVLVIALGYHANRLYHRPPPPRASFPGAPANTAGMARGETKFFTVLPGKAVDPAELERFRSAERARGNVVEEVGPGHYVSRPATAQARGRKQP
jgi:hypothetical protein